MKEETTDAKKESKAAPESKESADKTLNKESGAKTNKNQTTSKEKAPKKDLYDEQKDIETNKGMAALAYLLFFLPLVTEPAKTSKFARFHANQGLVYWIFYIGFIIVTRILDVIFWNAFWNSGAWGVWRAFNIIYWLLYAAYAALGVWCAIRAYQGKRKKIPLIGKITIIKEEVNTAN